MRAMHIAFVIGFCTMIGCEDGSGDEMSDDITTGLLETTAHDTSASLETTSGAQTEPLGTEGGDDADCIPVTWYRDADGDGRGDPEVTTMACTAPPGYVGPADDCDDTDPNIHPFADEICDGVDNNCNDLVDEHSQHNLVCNGCTTAMSNGIGYWFCPEDATWPQGRQRCAERFAADLVKIDDAGANAFIVATARAGPGSWYIGLNDIDVEGVFVWPDGSPATYTNWNPGEPNNTGGLEDCVEMGATTGGWNDIPCETIRPFICGASVR